MPLYEYYCATCKTKFEALRSRQQADTPIQCPQCESSTTSRVLSLFAAHTGSQASAPETGFGGGGCCGGGSCGCAVN